MLIWAVDPLTPDSTLIARAAAALRDGRLVAFPTETVYGLGACASSASAVRAVFEAKGRPPTHPLIVHVLDAAMAEAVATRAMPATARALCAAFWPGPLTVVVPRAARLPADVCGGGDTVGVRAPSHPVARALIAALGDGIAAPSANRYQRVSATRAEHVSAGFTDAHEAAIFALLDAGPAHEGIESTVVDCTGDVPAVLRLGALPVAALRAVVPTLVVRAHEVAAEGALHVSPGMAAAHYQPSARVVIVPASRLGEYMYDARNAVLVMSDVTHAGAAAHVRPMPRDARAYAHELYAALHEIDALGAACVVVEEPPQGDAWDAIHDRLRRASS